MESKIGHIGQDRPPTGPNLLNTEFGHYFLSGQANAKPQVLIVQSMHTRSICKKQSHETIISMKNKNSVSVVCLPCELPSGEQPKC
eukprot:6456968-Amphidinium_carterae.1